MAEYKVIRVSEKPSNAWNGPNGTIYYQNYMLEGHTKPVSIGKKQPDTIKVGDVLNGNIIQDSGPNDKFKAEFVQGAPKPGGYAKSPVDQDSIVRQSALKSSVASFVDGTTGELVERAEVFYAWLTKGADIDTPGYDAARATAEKLRVVEDGKDELVAELTDLDSLVATEPDPGEIDLTDIPF